MYVCMCMSFSIVFSASLSFTLSLLRLPSMCRDTYIWRLRSFSACNFMYVRVCPSLSCSLRFTSSLSLALLQQALFVRTCRYLCVHLHMAIEMTSACNWCMYTCVLLSHSLSLSLILSHTLCFRRQLFVRACKYSFVHLHMEIEMISRMQWPSPSGGLYVCIYVDRW